METSWFFGMGVSISNDIYYTPSGEPIISKGQTLTFNELVSLNSEGKLIAGALSYTFTNKTYVEVKNIHGENVIVAKLSGELQDVYGGAISKLYMGQMLLVPNEGYRNYPAKYYFGWSKDAWENIGPTNNYFNTSPEIQALANAALDVSGATYTGAFQDPFVQNPLWKILPYENIYTLPPGSYDTTRSDNFTPYTLL